MKKPKKGHPWRKAFKKETHYKQVTDGTAWCLADDLDYLPIMSDEDIIEEYAPKKELDTDD